MRFKPNIVHKMDNMKKNNAGAKDKLSIDGPFLCNKLQKCLFPKSLIFEQNRKMFCTQKCFFLCVTGYKLFFSRHCAVWLCFFLPVYHHFAVAIVSEYKCVCVLAELPPLLFLIAIDVEMVSCQGRCKVLNVPIYAKCTFRTHWDWCCHWVSHIPW